MTAARANGVGGAAAIAGVGFTELTRSSGRTVADLAAEACRRAAEDAGVPVAAVDGIADFSWFGDSVPGQGVAAALGIPRLRYCLDLNLGGQAPCFAALNAAGAIASGMASHVLLFRALNGRSESRVGSRRLPVPTAQYHLPTGLTAYPQQIAMWARRLMIETGTTNEDLAAVAIRQREYAGENERALLREPLSLEGYFEEPLIVDPFRRPDCTIEVDGACAVLITSVEEARALRHPPAVILGGAWATGPQPGLDGSEVFGWEDMSRNFTSHLADDLWRSAGVGPSEMDFAQIYDCFTSTVLFGLEGLGLVGRGEAGPFVSSGESAIGGKLPVNTAGGLLSEGYLQGMNTLAEAALQIQGRALHQVPGTELGVVTSGAQADGSALVLGTDAR